MQTVGKLSSEFLKDATVPPLPAQTCQSSLPLLSTLTSSPNQAPLTGVSDGSSGTVYSWLHTFSTHILCKEWWQESHLKGKEIEPVPCEVKLCY